MKTLRISVAIVASVAAFSVARIASAQEQPQDPAPQPVAPPPQQQTQPVQNVTVAPPAQQQVQPVQQQPVGQTTTTAAPYGSAETTQRTYEKRPHSTLLSAGVGLFVIGYGSSVVAGAVSGREEDKNLFIPVVGPWLDLADRDCSSRPCGGNEDLAKAMIVTSGIVQGAGLLMGVSSLFVPETTSMTEEKRRAALKPKVSFTPVSLGAGAGAGLVGRF